MFSDLYICEIQSTVLGTVQSIGDSSARSNTKTDERNQHMESQKSSNSMLVIRLI